MTPSMPPNNMRRPIMPAPGVPGGTPPPPPPTGGMSPTSPQAQQQSQMTPPPGVMQAGMGSMGRPPGMMPPPGVAPQGYGGPNNPQTAQQANAGQVAALQQLRQGSAPPPAGGPMGTLSQGGAGGSAPTPYGATPARMPNGMMNPPGVPMPPQSGTPAAGAPPINPTPVAATPSPAGPQRSNPRPNQPAGVASRPNRRPQGL